MKKSFSIGITSNLAYSIGAMIALNGVLQLIIYPYLTKELGADSAGVVISLMSVVAIIGATFGSSANYSRLIRRMHYDISNGDFNIFLLISFAISVIAAVVTMLFFKQNNALNIVLFALLLILSVARYYGDVEFRLSLNYKGYFIYYLLTSLGYLLGIGLFLLTRNWMLIIIAGEAAALFFVYIKGTIFRPFKIECSEHFGENIKSMFTLTGSNLLTVFASNADRIIIMAFLGATAVTVFYASSIIGKIISLLTVPMNSVLIGYITVYNGEIKRKHFLLVGIALLLVCIVMIIVCTVASNIFVRILYADVFEAANPLFLLANTGQIFYFISSTYMLILLRITDESYQLFINLVYLLIFLAVTIPATILYNLTGMAYAILAANAIKFLLIFIIGMLNIKRND